MNAETWQLVLSVLGVAVGGAIAALLKVYAPGVLAAMQTTANASQQTVDSTRYNSAVQTSAGIVQTKLDTGSLTAPNVTTNHPAIAQEAQALIARIPDVVSRLGKTPAMVSAGIVGAVDTSPARLAGTPVALPANVATLNPGVKS